MNFLERALTALSTTMERPQPYGWFHIMFVVIMVVVTIAVSLLLRKKSDKTIRVVVLTYAAICLLFEVYKQLLFSYTPATNTWDYQWYAFPFQFCSTPMYVALVAGLIKKRKSATIAILVSCHFRRACWDCSYDYAERCFYFRNWHQYSNYDSPRRTSFYWNFSTCDKASKT